ncbi:unnamed protein product [Gongylonema pulchrum]|uniref:G_PROTEIN_RECEP_F1_2 domain-containing protein n=1 Tax=Gongylonema pulchrum TaxID=637853 RepID=A0A183DB66_9BILA|nr:unnamed protein product [Gongylonema pulchrum]
MIFFGKSLCQNIILCSKYLWQKIASIDDELDAELEPEFDEADVGRLTTFNCTSSAVSDFYSSIQCTPMPNALNPCEDVVGFDFLRWAIWFVWISAIVGNVGVWIVLCHTRQKAMQVHYFFMANLSAADLLTGEPSVCLPTLSF